MSRHQLQQEPEQDESVRRNWVELIVVFGAIITVIPLLLWGGLSVIWLARAVHVPAEWAWTPALATTGVMIVSTIFSMNDTLDKTSRWFAAGLSVLGIIGDAVAAAAQHYLQAGNPNPATIHPHPFWGAMLGVVPVIMGGLEVKLIFRWIERKKHLREAAIQAAIDAEKAAEQARINQQLAEQEQARIASERVEQIRLAEAQAAANTSQARLLEQQAAADTAAADRLRTEDRTRRAAERAASRTTTGQSGGQRRGQGADNPAAGAGQTGGQNSAGATGVDVSDLLDAGRTVALDLHRRGDKLDRDALRSGLRSAGLSCSSERLAALLKVLKSAGEQQRVTSQGPAQTGAPSRLTRVI